MHGTGRILASLADWHLTLSRARWVGGGREVDFQVIVGNGGCVKKRRVGPYFDAGVVWS